MRNILLSTLFLSTSMIMASSGSIAGNGSDHYDFGEVRVWFQNNKKTVHWCAESKDSHYGIKDLDLQRNFKAVIEHWKKYLNFTNANKYIPESMKASFKYKLVDCDSELVDLRIIMGDLKDVAPLGDNYKDPYAFVEITDSTDWNWNRGTLFLRSVKPHHANSIDWSKLHISQNDKGQISQEYVNLYGALLHEFGHILGVTHRSETIMTPNIKKYLLGAPGLIYPDELRFRLLRNIDHRNHLFVDHKRKVGYLGFLPELRYWNGTEYLLKIIGGKLSKANLNDVRMSFSMDLTKDLIPGELIAWKKLSENEKPNHTIAQYANFDRFSFSVKNIIKVEESNTHEDVRLFTALSGPTTDNHSTTWLSSKRLSFVGQLVLPNGDLKQVFIKLNHPGENTLVIDMMEDEKKWRIFASGDLEHLESTFAMFDRFAGFSK